MQKHLHSLTSMVFANIKCKMHVMQTAAAQSRSKEVASNALESALQHASIVAEALPRQSYFCIAVL